MQVFIQTVAIQWTKASRGAELAALRALISKPHPVQFQPQLPGPLWHVLTYSEENRFATPLRDELKSTSLPFQFASSRIEWEDEAAMLTYRYEDGAPARTYYDGNGTLTPIQHSLRVPGNSWAYLEHNNRQSDFDTGAWWYEHIIINVAVGPQIGLQNPFNTSPIGHLSQLSQLW